MLIEVTINFNQPSYEVMENNTVTIAIALSQPSPAPFQVTIDGKSWLVLIVPVMFKLLN